MFGREKGPGILLVNGQDFISLGIKQGTRGFAGFEHLDGFLVADIVVISFEFAE